MDNKLYKSFNEFVFFAKVCLCLFALLAVTLAEPPVPSQQYLPQNFGPPSSSYGPPGAGGHTDAIFRGSGGGRPGSQYGAPRPSSQYGPPGHGGAGGAGGYDDGHYVSFY